MEPNARSSRRQDLPVRRDEHGTPRSRSNCGDMEQKDHVLRIARGVEFYGGSLRDFIELLSMYVDGETDEILDEQPLYRHWMGSVLIARAG